MGEAATSTAWNADLIAPISTSGLSTGDDPCCTDGGAVVVGGVGSGMPFPAVPSSAVLSASTHEAKSVAPSRCWIAGIAGIACGTAAAAAVCSGKAVVAVLIRSGLALASAEPRAVAEVLPPGVFAVLLTEPAPRLAALGLARWVLTASISILYICTSQP
ncbi:hypothetical protein FBU31_003621 [Coemansia sp. 'formosensis']|nr:hypothetical protein FBU31_003621 [Coemansia sp. 'formosensis']